MLKYFFVSIIFSIGFLIAVENNEYKVGYYDGKYDAVGEEKWFFCGLLAGPFGVGASFILRPTYSSQNIDIHLSEDYLKGYAKGYEEETALKNIQLATTGFLTLASILILSSYD